MVSLKLMDALFSGGHSRSVVMFPVRAVYMLQPRAAGAMPAQLLISVPKRKLHHAVDRNRVKRQVREAYRKHKDIVCQHIAADRQLALAVIWLADKTVDSTVVEEKVVGLLRRISEKLQ